jgi:hypothetical protein
MRAAAGRFRLVLLAEAYCDVLLGTLGPEWALKTDRAYQQGAR